MLNEGGAPSGMDFVCLNKNVNLDCISGGSVSVSLSFYLSCPLSLVSFSSTVPGTRYIILSSSFLNASPPHFFLLFCRILFLPYSFLNFQNHSAIRGTGTRYVLRSVPLLWCSVADLGCFIPNPASYVKWGIKNLKKNPFFLLLMVSGASLHRKT
jgi:hypothetical protein